MQDTILTVINPANGEQEQLTVDSLDALESLIDTISISLPDWQNKSVAERAVRVGRFIDLLEEHKEKIANAITLDMGKPYAFSIAEVDRSISAGRYYCLNAIDWLSSHEIAEASSHMTPLKSTAYYEPVGIVGVITPWNFPCYLAVEPIIFSLLAGNGLIFKPSEYTIRSGRVLSELLLKAFPEQIALGFIGGREHGSLIVRHPKVRIISFTGSTESGRKIMESGAPMLKRFLFELGGLDAALVLNDVEIEKVAKQIVAENTRNSGQACNAVKRVFVAKEIYKDFLEAAIGVSKNLVLGDPFESVDMGPLVAKFQIEKAHLAITDAISNGGKILSGGKAMPRAGYYFPSTIVSGLSKESLLLNEEAFCPILPIVPIGSIKEGIELINLSKYGLMASIWSSDIERAENIARELKVGVAQINYHGATPAGVPWGGVRDSGIGRARTADAMHEYCDIKAVRIFRS